MGGATIVVTEALVVPRARLEEMLDGLAAAIDSGAVTPVPGELEAIVVICERSNCGDLAARVRRWLAEAADLQTGQGA